MKEGYNILVLNTYSAVNGFKEDIIMNFQSVDFLRGIFTILRAFNVRYERFLLGLVIRVKNVNGRKVAEYYDIQGYPLPYYPLRDGISITSFPMETDLTENLKLCNVGLNQEY